MSDLEPTANQKLTVDAPTDPQGSPDGPTPGGPPQPQGVSQPEPENSGPTAASELEHKPQAPDPAHLAGIPDTLPPTWCPNCKADVLPKGKGHCPRCARMLKGSFLARRHPVNILRRQQLLDKLIADYRPQTTMLLATCEHLAGILEQLETLKPGSPDHQRLVQLSQQLGAALEESRPAPPTSDYSEASLDQLAERAAKLNELIAHLQANRDMRDDEEREARESLNQATVAPPETSAPNEAPSTTPEPEPRCEYCHGLASRCVTISNDPRWLGEHLARPDVAAHLEKQAAERHRFGWDASTARDAITQGVSPDTDDPTAVMFKMFNKRSPYL